MHRPGAGIFRRRSELARRRRPFEPALPPFVPQCCRASIRRLRNRPPIWQPHRSPPPRSLVLNSDIFSFFPTSVSGSYFFLILPPQLAALTRACLLPGNASGLHPITTCVIAVQKSARQTISLNYN